MNEQEDRISEGLAIHQGKPCPYCGEPMVIGRHRPTRDHIFPKRRRAPSEEDKILIVCRLCNEDKSDMTIQQFAARLVVRRDPRASLVAAVIAALELPSRRKKRPVELETCRWCGRGGNWPAVCKSVRDMTDKAINGKEDCLSQLVQIVSFRRERLVESQDDRDVRI